MYCLYSMEKLPSIVILICKKWEKSEQIYCDWIMRYIRYHGGKTHPRNMGKKEIEAFLSHLAVQQNVAASTQHQTLNAIVFLYKNHFEAIPISHKSCQLFVGLLESRHGGKYDLIRIVLYPYRLYKEFRLLLV